MNEKIVEEIIIDMSQNVDRDKISGYFSLSQIRNYLQKHITSNEKVEINRRDTYIDSEGNLKILN